MAKESSNTLHVPPPLGMPWAKWLAAGFKLFPVLLELVELFPGL